MVYLYLLGGIITFVFGLYMLLNEAFDTFNEDGESGTGIASIIAYLILYGPLLALFWPVGLPWLYYQVVIKPKQPEAVAKADYIRRRNSMMREERVVDTEEPRREHINQDDLYKHIEEAITTAVNAYDENKYTPLMNAVRKGDLKSVRVLLSQGANPKLTEGIFRQATALSMAITTLNRTKDQHTRDTYQAIIDILKPIT